MAQKIGVFDSGVGGLSVLQEIWKALPHVQTCYVADQIHVPYGSKHLEEVRSFAEGITNFLIDEGCTLIVVACNTASAASLRFLRERFPFLPFVGMEPALKPAAEHTSSGVVGVLATPATFQGALYASVLERFASHVEIRQHTCPGLVEKIEAGELDSLDTREILEEAIIPMTAAGIDTIVLGCTHYPFVIPLIQEIAGPGVRVIDPSPAVARQVKRVSERLPQESGDVHAGASGERDKKTSRFWTTAHPGKLLSFLSNINLIGVDVEVLRWMQGDLKSESDTLGKIT